MSPALAALVISGLAVVLSSVFAYLSAVRSVSAEYIQQLEKRITECERDRTDLHRTVKELRDRELELLTRIVRLEST